MPGVNCIQYAVDCKSGWITTAPVISFQQVFSSGTLEKIDAASDACMFYCCAASSEHHTHLPLI